MGKRLMTPGPTPVPKEIMEEMAKPIIHHRTPEYQEIFKDVNMSMKKVLRTESDVAVFASSGTGAMEASVTNILSPGDKAVVVRGGKFGERFGEICQAYGVEVIPMDIEWGTAPDPKKIDSILRSKPGVKAVYTTLCETSTATVYDIKAIGGVVKNYEAALVVDIISGLCADDFWQDAWNVDMAVGGSQKGLMIPPGLGFVSVSKKAWKAAEGSKLPKFYFDIKKYKKAAEKEDVPYTPAITLMVGLKKALDMINARGLDKVLAESAALADYLRNTMKGMKLEIYSKAPSNAVTAVKVPAGLDGSLLVKGLKTRGIIVAGGQGELKGKIFRIAHMGAISREDVDATINALKETLKELKIS